MLHTAVRSDGSAPIWLAQTLLSLGSADVDRRPL